MTQVITEITHLIIYTSNKDGLQAKWKIELNEVLDHARAKDTQTATFFGSPVGLMIPQLSPHPEAVQNGKSKDEVIEKVVAWLDGKSHDDVFLSKK